jgi:hypothetical protein
MSVILNSVFMALFLLIIICILWWAVYYYSAKIRAIVVNNKKKANSYAKDVSIGMASGIMVVVVDKLVTSFFVDLPKIDAGAGLSFVFSILNVIFYILLFSGALMLCVSFIYYCVIKHLEKE